MKLDGRLTAAIVAAAILVWAVPAEAGNGKAKGKPKQVPDTGVDEVIETTAAQDGEAALEHMTSRPAEEIAVQVHPDGMLSADLEGRFMNVAVASTSASGEVIATCHEGHDAAAQARAAKAPAKKKAASPAAPKAGAELEVR